MIEGAYTYGEWNEMQAKMFWGSPSDPILRKYISDLSERAIQRVSCGEVKEGDVGYVFFRRPDTAIVAGKIEDVASNFDWGLNGSRIPKSAPSRKPLSLSR